MPKTWKLKPLPEEGKIIPELHPILSQLLMQRGIRPGDAERFLHITYDSQYDPFLFRDMRLAIDRVWKAIADEERIVIYGDYDADAVTANSVLQQTFRYLGVDVGSYVPDRFTEGYGLNIEAFEKIKVGGATVVVTVDCGTNSVDVAEWCKVNGIDLIITDHHEITGDTPESFALINPKNPGDVYPDPQITGVGVAYKFAKALLGETEKVQERLRARGEQYTPYWDKWLLDLVAIGTVADCHSLLGENRIFVKYGLLVLAKTRWQGLRALLERSLGGKEGNLDTYTLGFLLAPRINAAGRLEHANIALDTLLAKDPITALQMSEALEKVNERRQDLTARLISEAREQAVLQQHYKVLVLASPDWPKGIVGIAAGRIANEFAKPVIVLEQGEEESTGSARTHGSFDVVEALKAVSAHLTKFGGHKEAAGLTLKTENLESFRADLAKYAEGVMRETIDEPPLELDAVLDGADLTLDFYDMLEELAPFGAGNPKPQFWLKDATVTTLRPVGKESKHVQFGFSIGGKQVQGIGFSMGHWCDHLVVGENVDVAAELLADTWNGMRKLKLRVVDIKKIGPVELIT